MRAIAEIDKEIRELEEQLEQVEGRPTEVYSRIVGYYRSLRNWNRGKREEYTHRNVFDSNSFANAAPAERTEVKTTAEQINETKIPEQREPAPVRYMYFYRETCPNCPPVRSLLQHIGLPGTEINVDTDEGVNAALDYGIYAAPTVVFVDSDMSEVYRASSVGELNKLKIPQIA